MKQNTKKKAAFLAAVTILGGTQLASAGPFLTAATDHITTMSADVTSIGIALMAVVGLIALFRMAKRMVGGH